MTFAYQQIIILHAVKGVLYLDTVVTSSSVSPPTTEHRVKGRKKNLNPTLKPFKCHHSLGRPRQTETSQATNKNTRNSNPRTREADISSASQPRKENQPLLCSTTSNQIFSEAPAFSVSSFLPLLFVPSHFPLSAFLLPPSRLPLSLTSEMK
jgi:hypothetical protein